MPTRSLFRVGVLGDLMNVRVIDCYRISWYCHEALGTCATASATLIDVIYKGVVKDGIDGIGLFGPAGADLTGDAFVATFNMDTSKGSNPSTPTENYIHGGVVYGTESPMIKATLEINGKSATVDGSYNGTVQAFSANPASPISNTHVGY